MSIFNRISDKLKLPDAANALGGRDEPIVGAMRHFINGHSLHQPYPQEMRRILFGLGCFWGAERIFWNIKGVYVTAVGYMAGLTPNPTYKEVCTGLSGHNEVVLVIYDENLVSIDQLLNIFWENHDPTQGMGQGNDRGTQYRSGIYTTTNAQHERAIETKKSYQLALNGAGYGQITTEIIDAPEFYFAEEYHQQYLEKNLDGYCGIGGTGVACAAGLEIGS